MKKFFNFRPLVVLSLSGILGVVSAVYYFVLDNMSLYLLIVLLLILTYLVFDILFFHFISSKYFISILATILFFAFSFFIANQRLNYYMKSDCGNGKYTITGTVVDENKKSHFVLLDEVVLQSDNKDISINGRVIAFYNENISFVENDIISFVGNYKYNYVKDGKVNVKYISNNTVGSVNIYNKNIVSIKSGTSSLRNKTLQLFNNTNENKFLSDNNFAIAKAFLFGDKSDFATGTQEIFSGSGVMHLFAVSGLHIGFLSAIVTKLLTYFTKNKKISSLIVFIILILYAYICQFSPSVTRALIMMGIVLFASLRGKQYDGLNALSIFLLAIILISPFQLFSVGLLLSVFAVFGIFCFYSCIDNCFEKLLPEKLSSYLAVIIAAQIGTIPILAYYFKTIQFVSFFTNILSVYLASFCYGILFFVCILSALFPFISIVYIVPNFLLGILFDISSSMVALDINLSLVKVSLFSVYLYYIGVLMSSEFSFIKRKYLYFISAVGVFFIGLLINNV